MKILIVTVLMLFSATSYSQDMMQKVMEMQRCMEGVDQQELQRIGEKAQEFQQEMKALCANGKSGEVRKQAMAFGQKMKDSESLAKIQECSKIMEGLVPDMAIVDVEEDYSDMDTDICESF